MTGSSVRRQMQKAFDLVSEDIASLRTGRANASMVQRIQIAAYGGTQKLQIRELASIATPDAETIEIKPWDGSVIGEIKKGIEAANVGLNPGIDGEIVRIRIPPMTTEDRQEKVKVLRQKIESGRVMIRQIRSETMKGIKNAFGKKEIAEDEKYEKEKDLQELTDEFVSKIEDLGVAKERELVEV